MELSPSDRMIVDHLGEMSYWAVGRRTERPGTSGAAPIGFTPPRRR